MRAEEFVASRRDDWNNLENLIARGSAGRLNPLRPQEVLALAALYRRATADLARAQRDWPGEPVHRYLNGLVARGHGVVYRRGGDVWRRIKDFYLVHHHQLWTNIPPSERVQTAGLIMTNNIWVSMLAFGFGVFFGLPVIWVMVSKGISLGGLFGL